uniref:Protein kinase domain-containing protein n=1 Tax=Macrostomum lignano TaxID=282301 RepID=A0A1I8FEX9_9PLAT
MPACSSGYSSDRAGLRMRRSRTMTLTPMVLKKKVEVKENSKSKRIYTIHEVIGSGRFGEVWQVHPRKAHSSKQFAAKYLKAGTEDDARERGQRDRHHEKRPEASPTAAALRRPSQAASSSNRVIDENFDLNRVQVREIYDRDLRGIEYIHSQNSAVMFGTLSSCARVLALTTAVGTRRPICGRVAVILLRTPVGLSPFMGKRDADTYVNIARVNYSFNYSEFDEDLDRGQGLCQTAAYQGPQISCLAKSMAQSNARQKLGFDESSRPQACTLAFIRQAETAGIIYAARKHGCPVLCQHAWLRG